MDPEFRRTRCSPPMGTVRTGRASVTPRSVEYFSPRVVFRAMGRQSLWSGGGRTVWRLCQHVGVASKSTRRSRNRTARLGSNPARNAIPGAQIGPYPVVRWLGAGGMGSVVLAIQEAVGRRLVAIKVMHGNDPELINRMEREIRILGALRSTRIVQVFDAGRDSEGRPYLVMEYCPGGSIVDQIALRSIDAPIVAHEASELSPPRTPKLSIGEAGLVVATVAEALGELHTAGVVHRDVKPSNVLVTAAGESLLGDFGIVRVGAEITSAGMVGTALYSAPELRAGEPASQASDVYALGVMAYELFAGIHPYAGSAPAVVEAAHMAQRAPLLEVAPECPSEVAALIEACMSPDPFSRPTDLEELAAQVRDFIACAPLEVRPLTDETVVDHLGDYGESVVSGRRIATTWLGLHPFRALAVLLAILVIAIWIAVPPLGNPWGFGPRGAGLVALRFGTLAGWAIDAVVIWVTSYAWSERSDNQFVRWWVLGYLSLGIAMALTADWYVLDHIESRNGMDAWSQMWFVVAFGYVSTFLGLLAIQLFGGTGRWIGRRAGVPRLGWWFGLAIGAAAMLPIAYVGAFGKFTSP